VYKRQPYGSGWLNAHEAGGAGRLFGGHTLAEHVGKALADLRARLASNARLRQASSYASAAEAEQFTEMVLTQRWSQIEQWLQRAWSPITENLSLDLNLGGQRVGIVLNRGAATTAQGTGIHVELIRLQAADGSWTFFVNTSFPTL
ncbi:RNase A-like domain-containing protein, partial [Corallococcus exiguus]|uniref:RNase A-like domain-containing protein n=1 Tax=Corallococcus exiguus TaxID=83462 RepID=UPI001C12E429